MVMRRNSVLSNFGNRSTARFLNRVIPSNPDSIAATLNLDLFVDHIVPHLHVEDILALRRVNKHYFHLTHEPLIWKTFLLCLAIPLPPIRPTLNFAVRPTDYEFEQLVSRAISMQYNWLRANPAVVSTMTFDAGLEVLDMKILPGGKYLVASIRDDYRFFIALYHLEHPSGPHVLARCEIQSKAYHLQAKYMMYKGEFVIMIAYVFRVLAQGASVNIDTAQFAKTPDIDPPDTMLHFLSCIHVDLSTLDLLAGVYRDPTDPEPTKHKWWSSNKRYKPFRQALMARLTEPATQVSLYSRHNVAHVSALQKVTASTGSSGGQDFLTIYNIEDHKSLTLIFRPCSHPNISSGTVHWIKAVRHIPKQDNIIAFRACGRTKSRRVVNDDESAVDASFSFVEMYHIPIGNVDGFRYIEAFESRMIFPRNDIESVCISDDYWPEDKRPEIQLRAHNFPPPPISIWIKLTRPLRGIFHWYIWPERVLVPGNQPIYYYSLQFLTKQTMHDPHPDDGHVVPGVYRSLIYTTEITDRRAAPSLTSLRRYISPEFQYRAYPINRVTRSSRVERRGYPQMPTNVYTKLNLGEETEARYMEHGLGAITWDEGIGRVCLTTGGGSEIQIIDFSSAAPIRERFVKWKMANPTGFRYIDVDNVENEFVIARKGRSSWFPKSSGSVEDVEDMDMDDDSDDSYSFHPEDML